MKNYTLLVGPLGNEKNIDEGHNPAAQCLITCSQ